MEETTFIDRLPLRAKADRWGGVQFDPVIKLVITHENVTEWNPKYRKYAYEWAFDTCYTGEILTSPAFLKDQFGLTAGKVLDRIPQGSINTHLNPSGHITLTAQSFGKPERIDTYSANAWILTDLGHFRDKAIRIPLNNGVAAQPKRERHLIGRDFFLGQGIKILIDFSEEKPSLSMIVPNKIISL